jgi:hypothetical protein
VTDDDDLWAGDIGHLALADAMLGALLIDMLRMLAHADYPEPVASVATGSTTGHAAGEIERRYGSHPLLLPPGMRDWLADVRQTTELRNQVIHAVALNQCADCGRATHFAHPRSGQHVDRSERAVRELTLRTLALHRQGVEFAERTADRVNAHIEKKAHDDAEATGEIQTPPQVSSHHATFQCSDCAPDGTASAKLRLGRAIEVWPLALLKAEIERLEAQLGDPAESPRDEG